MCKNLPGRAQEVFLVDLVHLISEYLVVVTPGGEDTNNHQENQYIASIMMGPIMNAPDHHPELTPG